MAVVSVYKKVGATPLEALEALRVDRPDLAHEPMTYAGRLDPMAEGVLLVLTGEDRYRAKEFQQLDKTYSATFLLGFSTDTGDVLGVVDRWSEGDDVLVRDAFETLLHGDVSVFQHRISRVLLGEHALPLPGYSSYKVKGKPLHFWAKSGRLHEIEVPTRAMRVHAVRDVSISRISSRDILGDIESRIALVRGDFRQEEILVRWRDVLLRCEHALLVSCMLDVSSGTYIRALSRVLEEEFHLPSMLFRLVRTRVG